MHRGEAGFKIGGGAERAQALLGLAAGGGRLVAAGGEARTRLGQRGTPRGIAIELTLGGFMLIARGVALALALAGGGARLGFGGAGGLQGIFGGLDHAARGLGIGAGQLHFGFDIGEAGALGQTAGGAGRGVGRGGKAVPAPQVAFGATPAAGRA